jgi:glycosyltransferase involved in cell wall biosynthesis
MRICALIPAFNSQATIARVVTGALSHAERVVVVNDGSTDLTVARARQAGAHVLGGHRNRGKGHALALGFAYVLRHAFDAAITLDADLQHNPAAIPWFVDRYQKTGAEMIIGNRMHSKEAIPRVRYVPNLIGNHCFSWLTKQVIEDSQCGFRFYHRKLLRCLPMRCNGFEAESDLLLRAGRRGFKIDFIPIEVIYPNGNGHTSFYRPVRDTYDICINFLKNWFQKER